MNTSSSWRWLAVATLALCLHGAAVAQNSTPPKDSDAPSEAPLPAGNDPSDGAIPERSYQPPDVAPGIVNSGQFQRWWWSYEQRTNGGAVDLQNQPVLNDVTVMNQQVTIPASPGLPGSRWVNVGSSPWVFGQVGRFLGVRDMSGRVATVAVDPSNPNHWLVGGAQGGVWETIDAGQNWVAKTDNTASLAMGAIAFAPSNARVIYAGTGEAAFSGDGYAGRGLLKSTDGGTNWNLLAASTFTNSAFSRLRVHPTNPNIAWASVTSGIAGRARAGNPPAPLRGIFKTTDGGATWAAINTGLPQGRSFLYGSLLGIDPRNPATLYAATDVGVFSLTAGVWSPVGSGLPLVPIADLDAVASGSTTVLTAATYGLGFYRTTA